MKNKVYAGWFRTDPFSGVFGRGSKFIIEAENKEELNKKIVEFAGKEVEKFGWGVDIIINLSDEELIKKLKEGKE